MKTDFSIIVDKLLEMNPDPIPQYVLLKEFKENGTSHKEYKNLYKQVCNHAVVKKIEESQNERGFWHPFHGYTEGLIRKCISYGLDKNHICLKNVSKYLGNVSVPAPPNNENIFGSVTGITVTIQGNGTLSLSVKGNILRIGAGQTVIVRDITLRGRSDNNDSVVIVNSGSIFRMEGRSSVTGNNAGGGGVDVSGGTFIMQDNASVTGNTASFSSELMGGGGVYLNGGTFIMQSGTISGNTCGNNGGGLYLKSGTFTMEGGTISGNSVAFNGPFAVSGGGVYIDGGTFTMQGGTISGNTARGSGGGVYLNRGNFTMKGGSISNGNNAIHNGGGVYVRDGTFTKTSGTIYGNDMTFGDRNTASQQGHAVFYKSSPDRWRNATAGPDDNTGGYGFWLND